MEDTGSYGSFGFGVVRRKVVRSKSVGVSAKECGERGPCRFWGLCEAPGPDPIICTVVTIRIARKIDTF